LLITFDLDGVLQVNPFGRGVFPEVCGKIGETLVIKHGLNLKTASQKVMEMIREESRRRLLAGAYVDAYDWDDIVLAVAKTVGSPARFDVEELVVKYCTPEYISSYPYAASTLAELSSLGIRLAVITNGFYKYQNPVMTGLGLRHFFDDFITPEMVGTVKPYAPIYQAAIKGEPNLCLHVGDTIIHDVWGAGKAGFQPVWVVQNLPGSLIGFEPWERPSRPEVDVLIRQFFESDLCPDAYPEAKVEDCNPAYIIRDLSQLLAVVEYAQRKVA
jgi:putative hydrolase of the HAD superfamily